MRRALLTATAISLSLLAQAYVVARASAYQVYPGCSVPGAGSGKVWYVDPVHGATPAAGADGSQAHPWNSLNGVVSGAWGASVTVPGYSRPLLSTVPYNHIGAQGRTDTADTMGNPPVNPGDTIMLMSGNYGDLQVGNFGLVTTNSDFVTVKAALGQTPVFTTMSVGGTNKWIFQGLKVQALNNAGVSHSFWLMLVFDRGPSFPVTDIIFDHVDISSADSLAGFTTQAQLQTFDNGIRILGNVPDPISIGGVVQPNAAGMPWTTCIALENSHIHHLAAAGQLSANNSLMTGNEIDHFGDDATEYGANNIAITHNYVHDNFDRGDGNHEDAFQGVVARLGAGVPYNAYSNILIDSNRIVRQTDPTIPFPTYLQGIDAFDEDWTKMTVTNNAIVTSSCWGITIRSIHNSLIASNTVVDDGHADPNGCTVALAIGSRSQEGPQSSNTRVSNNLATQIWLFNQFETGMSVDHNVALAPFNGQGILSWAPGATVGTKLSSGKDANGNISTMMANPYAAQFVGWNTIRMTYDLHLRPTSLAIGAGTSVGVPRIDIAGTVRTSPFAVGAYNFP